MLGSESDNRSGPEIEMFSGPGCTYCAASKELLDKKGLEFTEYDVSQPDHLAEFTRRLPRVRSIPQIFVDGEHIGTYEDLQMMVEAGSI